MTDKLLQANIKAAGMLGEKLFNTICTRLAPNSKWNSEEKCLVSPSNGVHLSPNRIFSIENAVNRDAVVQCLGEKHGYCICYHDDGDDGGWWVGDHAGYVVGNTNYYTTYIEAIAAAVLAVEEL